MNNVKLYHGDCLEIMPTLPQVDAIITDLPYGTTACSWDEIIPFEPMWKEVKRILKPRGVFVTTASQPFTSKLVMSNLDWFKYQWYWRKTKATGFLDAKRRPLNEIEDVLIFSEKSTIYNPQMQNGIKHKNGIAHNIDLKNTVYSKFNTTGVHETDLYYPKRLLDIKHETNPIHNTQKPVALLEYLIRTYTNEGDTVLDICAGSGTTGVAAINTGRNAILIEKESKYIEIIERRIAEAQQQPSLLEVG